MRERRKLFSWVSAFMIFILCIPAIRMHLFFGRGVHPVTLHPEKRVQEKAGDNTVYKGYLDDTFQLYYVENEGNIKPYAYCRRMGIWIEDYPNSWNIDGISFGNRNLYYYGEKVQGKDCGLVSPQGERVVSQTTMIHEKPYQLFIIKDYKKQLGVYSLYGLDENGKLIPHNEDTILGGEFTFYEKKGGKERSIELNQKEIQGMEESKRTALRQRLEEMIASMDTTQEIPEGRTYHSETVVDTKEIWLESELGEFLNVEGKGKAYTWTKTRTYHIELEGEHPNTISVNQNDFSEKSLYTGVMGEQHVYGMKGKFQFDFW